MSAASLSSFTGMAPAMLPNIVAQLREEFIPLITTLEGVNNTLNHTYLIELIFTLVNFDAFLRPEERDAFMRASDKLLSDLIKDLKKVKEMLKFLEENKLFLTEVIDRCTLLQDICETKLNESQELPTNLSYREDKRANITKVNLNNNISDNISPCAHLMNHSSDSSSHDHKQCPGTASYAYTSQCTTPAHHYHSQGLFSPTNGLDTASMQNNLLWNILFATHHATKDSFRFNIACRSAFQSSTKRSKDFETTQLPQGKDTFHPHSDKKRDNPAGASLLRQHLDLLLYTLHSSTANATQFHSSFGESTPPDDKFLASLRDFFFLPDAEKLQGKEGNGSLSLVESHVTLMKNTWKKCMWEILNGIFFADDLLLVGMLLSMPIDLLFASDHNIRNNFDFFIAAQKASGLMNSVGRQTTSPNSPPSFVIEAATAAATTHAAAWEKNNSLHNTNTIPKSFQPSSLDATHLLSVLGGVDPVRWEFWTVMQAIFTVLMDELLGKRPSDKGITSSCKNSSANDRRLGEMNENQHQPGVDKRHVSQSPNRMTDIHTSQYLHSSEMLRQGFESKDCSPSDQDLATCCPENDEYDAAMTSVSMLEPERIGQTDPVSNVHLPSVGALGLLKNVFCPNLRCYAVGARNFMTAAPLLAAHAATASVASVVSAAAAASAKTPLRSQVSEAETAFEPSHPLDTPNSTLCPSNNQDQNTRESIGNLGMGIRSHSSMDSFNILSHHSYTSSTTPASSTPLLSPNLFSFFSDSGLLTENVDDNASHENDNIRPVDVLVYAFITAIHSQLQQCIPISQESDALRGTYEQSNTTYKGKAEIHPIKEERTDETPLLTPYVTGDSTLFPLHIDSSHTVADFDGHAGRSQETGVPTSGVKRGGLFSAGGFAVCDLGYGLPAWDGAQRRRACGRISLVASMRDVLAQLLSDINSTILTAKSMENQLEGEITLLTFRIVSTIVDWLIPAVYLVDMRIWLFYRKWLCDLYQLLQLEGLLERFSTILNRCSGFCMVNLDKDPDTYFSPKGTNNPEMKGTEESSGVQEGCSDSQGNPSSCYKVDSVYEKTPDSLTTPGEGMFTDSSSANVFQEGAGGRHSRPPNYSVHSEPCCNTGDSSDIKSLHSVKSKQSKKQRTTQQQQRQRQPLLYGTKLHRSSSSTYNLPRTDISSSGLITRQLHLTPTSKTASTAERHCRREGLDIKPAVSLRVTPSPCTKLPHQHRQASSRKKSKYTDSTKGLKSPSNLFSALGMPNSERTLSDPMDNCHLTTNEQFIESPVVLESSIHTDPCPDGKDVMQLSRKANNSFYLYTQTALVVPGCGLPLLQQLQGGGPCIGTKQVDSTSGRGKGGSSENAMAAAVTTALLDKGTVIPLPKNYMLTRLIAAMVRGMETEAVRSLLGAFVGPSRDSFLREAKNETGELMQSYDRESHASRPLASGDRAIRRISSDMDTTNRSIHFQKMNVSTTQNLRSLPSSPSSHRFDGTTEFTQLMETHLSRNFSSVFTGSGKSIAVGEPSTGIRAPRSALNLNEGPGLVHHHRFRYPVIWDYNDVVTLYMNTLHDAEVMLSPHDPIRAALVQNTVGYMCLDNKNLRQALEILEYYLNDVSEERVQGPITKSVTLGRADGAVAVSTAQKGTPVSTRLTLGDPSTSPKTLPTQPKLSTRNPISPLIVDSPGKTIFSSPLSFPNKSKTFSITPANSVSTMGDNFGHLSSSTPSTQPKQLQEVPQVVPSWETTVERDQFIYVLSHLRHIHEKLKRRVDVV
ncbi:unnamed protein product [Phytomonas sp. Hart1]|nr:unnamed protein product [Phytomonas sp. Hart1]|eukprot:CCW69153.1 unnamed protein product [Phytomonas sp. isolate Hart1]